MLIWIWWAAGEIRFGLRDRIITAARNDGTRLHGLENAGVALLNLETAESVGRLHYVAQKVIVIHGSIDIIVNNAADIVAGVTEESRYMILSSFT